MLKFWNFEFAYIVAGIKIENSKTLASVLRLLNGMRLVGDLSTNWGWCLIIDFHRILKPVPISQWVRTSFLKFTLFLPPWPNWGCWGFSWISRNPESNILDLLREKKVRVKINQVFIRNVELEKKIMYVWNSSEILQILLTYFISLITTEHIIFVKNLQCIDQLQRLGIKPEIFFPKNLVLMYYSGPEESTMIH